VIRRRGAPRRDEPSARARLVETATKLFYQEGIRAAGIDTVLARSGVSKSALYRTFASRQQVHLTAYALKSLVVQSQCCVRRREARTLTYRRMPERLCNYQVSPKGRSSTLNDHALRS
jgi:AcrR family transcriptional regulator